MRAVVQRVTQASVSVAGQEVGSIEGGQLILLGVGLDDGEVQSRWLAKKLAGLRIFRDDEGRMNRSLLDISGEALVVSQFTLYGDCRKGRRPSFVKAAAPARANELYEHFCVELAACGVNKVARGVFGAMMDVSLNNDGPVTIIIDTP
ncbi:MAG: D-tyrosyl-tRNA(Tyr) deacylase [Proteobacteria bacterium]|nr:D-tyrosyl-tRNA(Tyr) deacylase [Pseudomonadota bacterium]